MHARTLTEFVKSMSQIMPMFQITATLRYQYLQFHNSLNENMYPAYLQYASKS